MDLAATPTAMEFASVVYVTPFVSSKKTDTYGSHNLEQYDVRGTATSNDNKFNQYANAHYRLLKRIPPQ